MLWGMKIVVPQQRIGVSLIALDEEERVFLLRHVFHPSVPWGPPGGWLGRNEDPAAGVLRELHEETGLTAVLGPVVHIEQQEKPDHIGIAYVGQIQPGTLKLNPEILEAAWFPIEQLPMPQYPFTLQAINIAVELQRTQGAASISGLWQAKGR